jgi:hypothetical protein
VKVSLGRTPFEYGRRPVTLRAGSKRGSVRSPVLPLQGSQNAAQEVSSRGPCADHGGSGDLSAAANLAHKELILCSVYSFSFFKKKHQYLS